MTAITLFQKAFNAGISGKNHLDVTSDNKICGVVAPTKLANKKSLGNILESAVNQLTELEPGLKARNIVDLQNLMADLGNLEARYAKRTSSTAWKFKKFLCSILTALKIRKFNPFKLHEQQTKAALTNLKAKITICLEKPYKEEPEIKKEAAKPQPQKHTVTEADLAGALKALLPETKNPVGKIAFLKQKIEVDFEHLLTKTTLNESKQAELMGIFVEVADHLLKLQYPMTADEAQKHKNSIIKLMISFYVLETLTPLAHTRKDLKEQLEAEINAIDPKMLADAKANLYPFKPKTALEHPGPEVFLSTEEEYNAVLKQLNELIAKNVPADDPQWENHLKAINKAEQALAAVEARLEKERKVADLNKMNGKANAAAFIPGLIAGVAKTKAAVVPAAAAPLNDDAQKKAAVDPAAAAPLNDDAQKKAAVVPAAAAPVDDAQVKAVVENLLAKVEAKEAIPVDVVPVEVKPAVAAPSPLELLKTEMKPLFKDLEQAYMFRFTNVRKAQIWTAIINCAYAAKYEGKLSDLASSVSPAILTLKPLAVPFASVLEIWGKCPAFELGIQRLKMVESKFFQGSSLQIENIAPEDLVRKESVFNQGISQTVAQTREGDVIERVLHGEKPTENGLKKLLALMQADKVPVELDFQDLEKKNFELNLKQLFPAKADWENFVAALPWICSKKPVVLNCAGFENLTGKQLAALISSFPVIVELNLTGVSKHVLDALLTEVQTLPYLTKIVFGADLDEEYKNLVMEVFGSQHIRPLVLMVGDAEVKVSTEFYAPAAIGYRYLPYNDIEEFMSGLKNFGFSKETIDQISNLSIGRPLENWTIETATECLFILKMLNPESRSHLVKLFDAYLMTLVKDLKEVEAFWNLIGANGYGQIRKHLVKMTAKAHWTAVEVINLLAKPQAGVPDQQKLVNEGISGNFVKLRIAASNFAPQFCKEFDKLLEQHDFKLLQESQKK